MPLEWSDGVRRLVRSHSWLTDHFFSHALVFSLSSFMFRPSVPTPVFFHSAMARSTKPMLISPAFVLCTHLLLHRLSQLFNIVCRVSILTAVCALPIPQPRLRPRPRPRQFQSVRAPTASQHWPMQHVSATAMKSAHRARTGEYRAECLVSQSISSCDNYEHFCVATDITLGKT